MNGLLICSGTSKSKNIGDYIQSVAQEQFLKHIDRYIERESLNMVDSDVKINLIMNSWYMWIPENFPPAKSINPLFISIHINPKIENLFFRQEVIDYLKLYEPIGARDMGTQRMLERNGIKSYFSGCLTLTLGKMYKTDIKNDKILFVDPYIFRKESPKLITQSLVIACWHLIKNPIKTHRLTKKIDYNMTRMSHYSKWLDRHLCMATFYNIYHRLFSDDFLFGAEYVTHNVCNIGVTDDEKMQQARNLIRLYAGAKIVVTSRIHAALPCLGVETPVIFITSQGLEATRENSGRFEGLIDFFNTITWYKGKLIVNNNVIKEQLVNGKITNGIHFQNPEIYKKFRDNLINIVSKWVSLTDK